jgi:putative DNA primase/helicase
LAKFSCWCPKAIARIGRLPHTLADRCIVFQMQRKLPNEECERLKNLDGTMLRRQCARFVLDHAEAIRSARPGIPPELNDRAADIWEPLLALADLVGGEWPERARQAAVGLSAGAQEGDALGTLLMDIAILFLRTDKERVFSKLLVAWLESFEDRPWMELRKGKAITELWLAQQLRRYGVRPKTMRIGEERAKGYEKEDLKEVFRRYIPRSELDAFRAELKAQTVATEKADGDAEHAKDGGAEAGTGSGDGVAKTDEVTVGVAPGGQS